MSDEDILSSLLNEFDDTELDTTESTPLDLNGVVDLDDENAILAALLGEDSSPLAVADPPIANNNNTVDVATNTYTAKRRHREKDRLQTSKKTAMLAPRWSGQHTALPDESRSRYIPNHTAYVSKLSDRIPVMQC